MNNKRKALKNNRKIFRERSHVKGIIESIEFW